MSIKDNTASLQSLLEQANALPGASTGVTLPTLSNPAEASEVFKGTEAINQNGQKFTGTFTIEEEIAKLNATITEIESALVGKGGGGGQMKDVYIKNETAAIAYINYIDESGSMTRFSLSINTFVTISMYEGIFTLSNQGGNITIDGDCSVTAVGATLFVLAKGDSLTLIELGSTN